MFPRRLLGTGDLLLFFSLLSSIQALGIKWNNLNCNSNGHGGAVVGNITDAICVKSEHNPCLALGNEQSCNEVDRCLWVTNHKISKCNLNRDFKNNVCALPHSFDHKCDSISRGKCPSGWEIPLECCPAPHDKYVGILRTSSDDLVCCNVPCKAIEMAWNSEEPGTENCTAEMSPQCGPQGRSLLGGMMGMMGGGFGMDLSPKAMEQILGIPGGNGGRLGNVMGGFGGPSGPMDLGFPGPGGFNGFGGMGGLDPFGSAGLGSGGLGGLDPMGMGSGGLGDGNNLLDLLSGLDGGSTRGATGPAGGVSGEDVPGGGARHLGLDLGLGGLGLGGLGLGGLGLGGLGLHGVGGGLPGLGGPSLAGLGAGPLAQAALDMTTDSSKDEHVEELSIDDFFLQMIDAFDNDQNVFEYAGEQNSDPWFGKTFNGGHVDGFSFIDPWKFIDKIYGSPWGINSPQPHSHGFANGYPFGLTSPMGPQYGPQLPHGNPYAPASPVPFGPFGQYNSQQPPYQPLPPIVPYQPGPFHPGSPSPGQTQPLPPIVPYQPGQTQPFPPIVPYQPGQTQPLPPIVPYQPGQNQPLPPIVPYQPGQTPSLPPIVPYQPWPPSPGQTNQPQNLPPQSAQQPMYGGPGV